MADKSIERLTRPVLSRMKEYSPGKPIWEVQQELGIKEVIKLSSNENPLGVSPLAQEAITRYVSELHRYPDAYTTRLREAISIQYDVSDEQVIVGNGGDEIITMISETFLEEGDEIIVPTPSFSEYEFGGNLMGAKVMKIPLNSDFEYDLDLISGAITEKTKLLYLCSPNNPTGTYIKKAELDTFLQNLPRRIIVVFDGAYSHYATTDDYSDGVEFLKQGKQIIVIQTFSKIFGLAGLRVGFGISSKEIVNSIHKVREPFNVNTLAQIAAEAAIKDVQHVEASRALNEAGKTQLYKAFNVMNFTYIKSMGNFILVNVGDKASFIYEQLMAKGFIVRYGGVWGLPNHLRVTIGTEKENTGLISALERILDDINKR